MESNRDEARREKAMAEERIKSNDFPGALTFAQRAQVLDPELDGISQMLSMLEVNISAQRRVGGEIDWYGVLGVDPTADQETIDNQYRKLSQALHPDTNPWNGASSALGLVSRANSLLSNRARRSTYDRIAGYRPIEVVGLPEAGEPSARAGSASVAPPPSAAGITWHDDSRYMGMWRQPPLVRYGGRCFDVFFPENFEVGSSSGGPWGECEACALITTDAEKEKEGDDADEIEELFLIASMMMEEDDEWFSHSKRRRIDDDRVDDGGVPVNNNQNVPEEDGGGGVQGVPGNNIQNVPEEGGGVGGIPVNNNENAPEENGDAESVYACW